MTKKLEVSPAVEAHLAARLPGWRHRVRLGKHGAWHLPVLCEVCGKIIFFPASQLEARLRAGKHLPRFCSVSCTALGLGWRQPV